MKRFLFVDDDSLSVLKEIFKDNPNVLVAQCFSVSDALEAIKEFNPDVLFLDHQLSRGGNEGFEIADKLDGVKIYSTTSSLGVVEQYRARGIEWVGFDLDKIEAIVSDATPSDNFA